MFTDQTPGRPLPQVPQAQPVAAPIAPRQPLQPVLPQVVQKSVEAPRTKVVFETEGWGQFTAMYHQVIKNDCLVVLVYDTRFEQGMIFFPPVIDDKLMAVRIEGSNKVYYVHSLGSRFKHGDYEYCVLVAESEAVVPGGE